MGYIALHTVKMDGKKYIKDDPVPVTGDAATRLLSLDAIIEDETAVELTPKAKAKAKADADAKASAAVQAAEADRRSKLTPEQLAAEDAANAAK